MSYKTILFDLDGTLTDPALGITKSVAYALDGFNIPHGEPETLKYFIGPPLREEFMKFTHTDDVDFGEKLVAKYREYYSVTGIYENRVYDGIPEMLSKLKDSGKTLAVATSKPEKFAKIILSHFGIDKYFNLCAGANMDNTRTNKADVIRFALSELGLECGDKNTVMVGDRFHDIEGAKTCGLTSVGVCFGHGTREELQSHGAQIIVNDTDELYSVLSV